MVQMIKKNMHFSVREIAYIALFTALIAVCAWISIPFGEIAFTMQTFAVFEAVCLLGTRRAVVCIASYILIGAVGAPVFANFTGGVGVLFGATGGYILGFIFTALTSGALLRRADKSGKARGALFFRAAALCAGLIVCYAFGTGWFLLVYAPRAAKSITLAGALGACVFPYILPDLCKIALALGLSRRLLPHIRL